MLLHVRMQALNACGNANYRKCNICKIYDDTASMSTAKNGNGQPRYWHKKCAAEYQLKLYYERKRASATLPVKDIDSFLEELKNVSPA